jgi:prophage antirepressor-like protein
MKKAVSFSYEDQPISVVFEDGKPWWRLSDVCDAIHATNNADIIFFVPEDLRKLTSFPSVRGRCAALSEAGLHFYLAYTDGLLAIPFQKWLVWKVMPAIRHMKGYKYE